MNVKQWGLFPCWTRMDPGLICSEQQQLKQSLEGETVLEEKRIQISIPTIMTSVMRSAHITASNEEN